MSKAPSKPARLVCCDPATALSQLFVPLAKSGGRPPLNLVYVAKSGGAKLRFSAREALGMPEQTLLLVLLELAQEQYRSRPHELAVISPSTAHGIGAYLWRTLHEGHLETSGESLHIETSWHELAGRCGSRGGRSRQLRKEQLQRLSEVAIWEEGGDALHSFRQSRLVSVWSGDDQRLHLAVNVRLARAVMGGQYAAVSLVERLELSTDTAQALHAFLSASIQPGHAWSFRVDTLMQRFYAGKREVPQGTRRRRRKLVRDALAMIGGLTDWEVTWTADDIASVSRKRAAVSRLPSRQGLPGIQPMGTDEAPALQEAGNVVDVFDATCFLTSVTDSPSVGAFSHDGMDFR